MNNNVRANTNQVLSGTAPVPLSKDDRGGNANLNPLFTAPPHASFGQFSVLGTVEATESEDLFHFKKKEF